MAARGAYSNIVYVRRVKEAGQKTPWGQGDDVVMFVVLPCHRNCVVIFILADMGPVLIS